MSNFKETIIDYGAGQIPSVAETMAKNNPQKRIIALEKYEYFSSESLDNLLKIRFSGEKGESLPVPSNSIDEIYASYILGEVSNEYYLNLLKEFKRVIKKDGKIYLSESIHFDENIKQLVSKAGLNLDNKPYHDFPEGSEYGERRESLWLRGIDKFMPMTWKLLK